jgi:hypothetical protein
MEATTYIQVWSDAVPKHYISMCEQEKYRSLGPLD